MEIFAKLFGGLLVFVYHCFDRIVINGYLSGLSRPEQAVYFFREVIGVSAVTKEVLSQRGGDYQAGWSPLPAITNSPSSGVRKGCARKSMFGAGSVDGASSVSTRGHCGAHKNSVGLLSSWLRLSPGRVRQPIAVDP
jgi:hypothetical protein